MKKYNLLSVEADSKTTKGSKLGYLTGVLYLAPANEASDVRDMCPFASDGCRKACLYGAGMAGVFPSIKRARIAKTQWFIQDPAGFTEELERDIRRLIVEASARKMTPAVRINGTSDQPKLAMELAARFPDVQFYDYTKIPRPWQRRRANYHVTFSFSGENLAAAQAAWRHGHNVAVVFDTPKGAALPATWRGAPVVDGDVSDLRFLDARGVIVGLRAKGTARKMTDSFIQISAAAAAPRR